MPPFNALPTAELEALARKLEAGYYPQGKEILQSSPPPGLAIIRKGAVRLIDAERKFLDKRSEGEMFGHRIYFHGAQKEYLAQAEEDCLVWHLPQDDFAAWCRQHPALAEYFESHVKTRVKAAAQVQGSAKQVRDVVK